VCPKFSARSKSVIGGKPEKRTIGPPTAIGGTLLSGAMEAMGTVIGTIIDVMIMLDATRTMDICQTHMIEMIGTTDTEMIRHTAVIGTATAIVNALERLRHKHAGHPSLCQ
jgi:hypothetical protein